MYGGFYLSSRIKSYFFVKYFLGGVSHLSINAVLLSDNLFRDFM